MNTPTIRKMGIPLLAGAMGLSFSVFAEDHEMHAQGLYSAEDLLGAEVFDANGDEVGNVEDILLGNDMGLHSIVVQTNEFLGIGERDVVVKRGDFTARVTDDNPMFGDVSYNVHVTAAGEELKGFEEYSEEWWNSTKENLNKAWKNTKETTQSAWENTKHATATAWHNTKESMERDDDKAGQE
ncbi:PRC-barrel domain-containing protein [Halopseudomonas sp.]|uniref:PRC-barrel domain-containing protein n=1 Tax=Halopseudomonas sp. TaxID=2901191 RepID=UPI0035687CC3